MNFHVRSAIVTFILISLVGISFQTSNTDSIRLTRSTEANASPSYFFYQNPDYPKDCRDVLSKCSSQNKRGVYVIKPDGYRESFEVYCDNENDGGGWTVIQRRNGGYISFNRLWKNYDVGFGFLSSEFWLGSKKLASLTNQKKYQLRIDLETSSGISFYITYDQFRISDEWGSYKLIVDGYNGTGGESVTWCPTNMKYGNCSCQATCDDPKGCGDFCDKGESCICAEGFLKKGEECVLPEECGCFVEGEGILQPGTVFVNSNCSRRCNCTVSGLSCDNDYGCDANADCEERNNVRQCYCNEGYTGDGQTCSTETYTDCQDIYSAGQTESKVYTIQPINSPTAFEVYCNMSDGGGWTVFQRRIDGDVDFYLYWNDYKEGFGSPSDEFWLGNDKLYYLTNQRQKNYELRIDLVNRYGSPYYAKYTLFRINDESDNYRLSGLGSFSGTAGYDAMAYHRNQPFTTRDRDNDVYSGNNAVVYHSAWWFEDDAECDLNQEYDRSGDRGIYWGFLPGSGAYIKFSEMKVRLL